MRNEPIKTMIYGAFALLAAFTIVGCNTISGAGKDIEATGEVITDTAEDAKQEIQE